MKYILRLFQKGRHIFINSSGKPASPNHIKYAQSLGIPPAYPFSMIFLNPDDLLVMSYDEAGRKQYIYCKEFIEKNAKRKFKNIQIFIHHLPAIKKKISKDINKKDPKTFENALIIKILLSCYLRIGSNNSVNTYEHYGISTLEKRHLLFKNKNVILKFIGKKGVVNHVIINDNMIVTKLKQLVNTMKNKDRVFQHSSACDVNQYLQLVNPELSTKMIRTYGANKLLIESLSNIQNISNSQREKTITLNCHIDSVAHKLQNTRTVLKNSYIIPQLLTFFLNDTNKFLKLLKNMKPHELLLLIIRKNI